MRSQLRMTLETRIWSLQEYAHAPIHANLGHFLGHPDQKFEDWIIARVSIGGPDGEVHWLSWTITPICRGSDFSWSFFWKPFWSHMGWDSLNCSLHAIGDGRYFENMELRFLLTRLFSETPRWDPTKHGEAVFFCVSLSPTENWDARPEEHEPAGTKMGPDFDRFHFHQFKRCITELLQDIGLGDVWHGCVQLEGW